MRIAMLSILGATCLAMASVADAKTATPSAKFYVNVHGAISDASTGEQHITFNAPVRVPNVTLQAGTYVFVKAGSNVVRVMSPDRTKTYATFFTLASVRSAKRGGDVRHAQVRFERRNAREPLRLVGLYPEGVWRGFEPKYPSHDIVAENKVAEK